MRRFVFVPIFGDTKADPAVTEEWLSAPHVKAWGFFEEGFFTPIHTDPPCAAIELHSNSELFDAEEKAMIDVPEDSTDLPEEVCVALAKLALCPELVEAN